MSNCDVVTPICILGQVWCLIVSIPDLCPLSFFAAFQDIFFVIGCAEIVNMLECLSSDLKVPLLLACFDALRLSQQYFIHGRTFFYVDTVLSRGHSTMSWVRLERGTSRSEVARPTTESQS